MMNSRKYSSSLISLPYVIENIKRFWLGSLLAFLGYFFSGPLPIIMMQYSKDFFIMELLSGHFVFYVGILVLVPVVCALLVYRYMQQQSATAIVNAMPFSRKSLFHANFLSGAILCIAPILLNAFVLSLIALLSDPVLHSTYTETGAEVFTNVFTLGAIWKWAGVYLLITLLIYAICMFSATITGSSLLQVIFSFGFLALLPGLLGTITLYSDLFLYGYTIPDSYYTLLSYLCPLVGLARGLSLPLVLWYAACFVLIYIAAYFLHKARKMERATDSITFGFLRPVFKYLATFFAMSLMAFLFASLEDGKTTWLFFLGGFIGALIGYVISEMILQKTLRIKGFIKGFAIYLIMAVVFFSIFIFDLTGYESRVPQASDIQLATITNLDIDSTDGIITSQDEEGKLIEALCGFHQQMLELNPGLFNDRQDYVTSYGMHITYQLENGSSIQRYYQVPFDLYRQNEELRILYESEDRKKNDIQIFREDPAIGKDTRITLSMYFNEPAFGKNAVILETDQVEGFIQALQKDMLEKTFAQSNSNIAPILSANIEIPKPKKEGDDPKAQSYVYTNYDILPYYTHTLQWISQQGLYDTLVVTAEDISYGEVYLYESQPVRTDRYGYALLDIYEETEGWEGRLIGTITDKAQLQTILDTGMADSRGDYGGYYEIYLYPNWAVEAPESGDSYEDTNADALLRYYLKGSHLAVDQAPDFIKNLE